MIDVFSPMRDGARDEARAAYRQYLLARDGTPDVVRRTLSRREQGMTHYERPLARVRELDRSLFLEQYARFDPKRSMSREAMLLLALVRINGAEAYAVGQAYHLAYQRALTGEDDMEVLLHIEETYHTRILLSASRLYGLDINAPYRPPLSLRALIGSICRGPELLSRPLTLAGELVGTVTFLNLLYAARDILKHDPELRDAIEERVTEVLIDEIGHISFNRMLLGAAGLSRARWLLPMVATGSALAVPVLAAIGLRTLSDDVATVTTSARLPEAVRRAAFVA